MSCSYRHTDVALHFTSRIGTTSSEITVLSSAAEAVRVILELPLRYTMLFQSATQGALQAVQLMLLAHSTTSPSRGAYPKNQPQWAVTVKQKGIKATMVLYIYSFFPRFQRTTYSDSFKYNVQAQLSDESSSSAACALIPTDIRAILVVDISC